MQSLRFLASIYVELLAKTPCESKQAAEGTDCDNVWYVFSACYPAVLHVSSSDHIISQRIALALILWHPHVWNSLPQKLVTAIRVLRERTVTMGGMFLDSYPAMLLHASSSDRMLVRSRLRTIKSRCRPPPCMDVYELVLSPRSYIKPYFFK